jgi:hypothetical protein
MQADKTSRLDNLRRLRELTGTGEVDIFSAHDPVELDRAGVVTHNPTNTAPEPR